MKYNTMKRRMSLVLLFALIIAAMAGGDTQALAKGSTKKNPVVFRNKTIKVGKRADVENSMDFYGSGKVYFDVKSIKLIPVKKGIVTVKGKKLIGVKPGKTVVKVKYKGQFIKGMSLDCDEKPEKLEKKSGTTKFTVTVTEA